MNTVFRIVMASVIVATAGCGRCSGPRSTAMTMAEQIVVGMSLEEVESLLDNAGMEYSYDPPSRTIYAIERNTGGGPLVKESKQIVVELDADSNVAVVNEKTVRTGP